MDEVFGPLVTGADVERAALDTLKLWTPEYLAWVERKTGRTPRSLPAPRSWVTASSAERWVEEQLPSVLLLSTGLAEPPRPDGRGIYTATFALGLAVVVSARDAEAVNELAKLYTATYRKLLLDRSSLGGLADGVEWVDERYDALPGDPKRRRQLASGQVVFRVEVPNVVSAGAGPATPRTDPYPTPYPDAPQVATADVRVQPEAIETTQSGESVR